MNRRKIIPLMAAFAAALPSATIGQAADADATLPALPFLEAGDVQLDDFLWQKRPLVIFADTPADPRFTEQIALLTSRPSELIERDVVVITDTDPDARSDLRRRLRPRGFQLTLIGKDGEVELRKPSPWSSREISRSIDKMPLRQQEVREQKAGAG